MSETGERRASLRSPDPNSGKAKVGPSVLFVDDNHAVVSLTAVALRSMGCRTLLARDGEKALQILDSRSSSIDVVVTDIDMPRMNGLELLRRIKQSGKHRDVPVIFWSGHLDTETLEGAAEYGCALYLSKPIEPEALFEQLTSLLAR